MIESKKAKRGYFTIIGYVLFLLGFLSILLSLVGLQLKPLAWISGLGLYGILIKIFMLFGGMIIMYFSKFPPRDE